MASLHSLVRGLPDALLKQYNYEIPHVTGGFQLMHSPFFQVGTLHSQPHLISTQSDALYTRLCLQCM